MSAGGRLDRRSSCGSTSLANRIDGDDRNRDICHAPWHGVKCNGVCVHGRQTAQGHTGAQPMQ